jgi:multidrug efflux pump
MSLSSLSIERPVLASVMSILLLLFGGIGFYFLGIREYPSVDPPVITVTTNYTGANAEVIESQITEVLEESVNSAEGIRSISSVSSDGRSTITVEFELGVDLERAANDVRDRVARAVRTLPPDTDPPVVAKSDANANPIVAFTVQSSQRNLLELTEIANNMFKDRLQNVPGVSEVRIWGEKRYAMKLLIDPARLAAYRLTPLDVRNALNRENVELPTGRIEGYNAELSIRTFGRLTSPEDFNELIISDANGSVIKFRDIGQAVLLPENERSILRGKNKIPMVGVAITPQPGSNYIAIADETYRRVEEIKKDLPADLEIGVAFDSTKPIRKGIVEVEETILIAFGLVVLIIFLFLRQWRTVVIPVIAIPISLIATFFIMWAAGFSINILTLLGIVLATGLVVDDAIVVMENIYAKIEGGMDAVKAGHEGSKEIFFAILSTTITLAAVFLPIIFLQGLTGRLFREFGVVVAGSVVISAFVSLSLTPMMSARLLGKAGHGGWFYRVTEPFFTGMTEGYRRLLQGFMRYRWVSLALMAASLALIFFVGRGLPSELAPMEDKSQLRLTSTAPEGTSFELMDKYQMQMLELVDSLPERESLIAVTSPGFGASVSVNSSFVRIQLSDPEERNRTQQQIYEQVSRQVRQYPFARTFVIQEPTIGGGRNSGLPVQYVIQAPDFERLRDILPRFMDSVNSHPAFRVSDLNLKFNKPELAISIDRDRARDLGVTVRDIAETIQLLFSGQRFGYFILNSKQYTVVGQAMRGNRDEPLDLSSVYVRNSRGELIQMDNLVTMSTRTTPPQLYRYNRYVAATISADPAPGVTLGQGIEAMDGIADQVLGEGFSTSLTGISKEFSESSNSLLFAFVLALLLVYLILAAQFESFSDPLVIMLTVPLALAGALLSLSVLGQTLNIFSQIGIIVLIGLVTKNGILIVEFANQRKQEGLSLRAAALDAAVQRLRPILMTSLASVLGALPIALGLGASSQSRVSMGISIVGGLLFSLLLTLFVIPVLYTYLSRRGRSRPAAPAPEALPQSAYV